MIETGTVKKRLAEGAVLVYFEHLGTEVECEVLQATTGKNTVCCLPSVGTQVVCSLEAGKNFALGAVFSEAEPMPEEADPDGVHARIGGMTLDISDGKANLKNDSTDLKSILNEFLNTLKNLKVTTPQGPGTLDPSTAAAVTKCEALVGQLLK